MSPTVARTSRSSPARAGALPARVASARTSAATELEALRLDVRARRMTQVVRALREREAASRRERGDVPQPLSLAIAGFERELAAIRRRLATLDRRGR
ncbi:MAG TPA: hypothetical protein VLK58_10375 [Conexibacter sp.]|nr:hypothetical protein [Conexibacter sp.]